MTEEASEAERIAEAEAAVEAIQTWSREKLYALRQEVSKRAGTMFYGDVGTIHRTGEVNVQLDRKGQVVSVWFRCMLLPFTQTVVDKERAAEMRRATSEIKHVIVGVEIRK